MDDSTYEKMVLMGSGKIARDQKWLDELAIEGHREEEKEAKAKYAREHPPARSRREMELEQRSFDLKMFGRSMMEKNAKPLDGLDELAVPDDAPLVRLMEHSVDQRPIPPTHLKLQHHDGQPGCKMWKV